jgi:hypothetical protein
MDVRDINTNPAWTLAAAALMVAAAVLAVVDAVGEEGAWTDALEGSAAVAGAALLGLVGARRLGSPWALVAAGAPVVYLALATAPEAVSLDGMPVGRALVSLAAFGAYVGTVRPLGHLPQYGLCCAALGVAAAFFMAWEPPPPKPVPIARPLTRLRDDLLAAMPGWTGEHDPLPEDIEAVLAADAYLNLPLSSPESPYRVQVFVAYNANAMTNIPHVPWVCMTQAGYDIVEKREDQVPHPAKPEQELDANVILFRPGPGRPPQAALMFQYFNIGGTYETKRALARILATSGAIGREGSYLTQTQVSVFVPVSEAEEAMARTGRPYGLGRQFLKTLIPILEERYYPDLGGSEGGG